MLSEKAKKLLDNSAKRNFLKFLKRKLTINQRSDIFAHYVKRDSPGPGLTEGQVHYANSWLKLRNIYLENTRNFTKTDYKKYGVPKMNKTYGKPKH